MTPEAKTKKKVRALLDEVMVYHFNPFGGGYGRAGIPDIIACVNGYFLAIECKAGKGKTTALQDRELENIRAAGGVTLVIYDTEEDISRLCKVLWALSRKEKP
jgi:Archaeal holliday junction resolvase (hjc)